MRDNLARKIDFEPVQEQRPAPRRVKKSKPRLGIIVLALICFAIGIVTVQRFAHIYSLSKQINDLKQQVYLAEAQNKQKKVEIDQRIDLATLESKATTELNMHKPEKNQIVYVDVKNADSVQIIKHTGGNKFFFALLMQNVKAAMGYLQ